MNPVEVLTSESQERMLAIVEPDKLDEVLGLCERWEIRASVVGRVNDSQRFRVFDGLFDASGVPGANPGVPRGDAPPAVSSDREPIADVPVDSLGDGPVYHRPLERPAALDAVNAADPAVELADRFPAGTDLGGELLATLGTPTIADKSWVWRQYDHQLFLNTVVGPGGDAAVLRIEGTPRALALATDGKGRFCRLDPRTGGRLVVLEAARNVACAGAEPRALVNCLNFGNPEHADVMWQFSEVVDGISEACTALGIPVIGGNVSFYNESRGADIDPTPVVGVIGLIDELTEVPPSTAFGPELELFLLGATSVELGGSEWAAVVHGLAGGLPPAADLDRAAALHGLVASLVSERAVTAVHDCSDGGLAVALSEMAIAGECGFDVELPAGLVPAVECFSESTSRVVVAVAPDRAAGVTERAGAAGVPCARLGTTGGDRLVVRGAFDVALDDATRAWRDAIPNALGQLTA
jgi:phosphoribosylformylglycinamidine synthase